MTRTAALSPWPKGALASCPLSQVGAPRSPRLCRT
jgi:hypothetical protein